MSLFDKPSHYNGGNGGDTLFGLVNTACERCGVVLATPNFQNRDVHVRVTLTETMTYRQIVSWAAQAAGCYARVNVNGELELKFYDFDALEGIIENGLDGGVFDEGSPYASGDSADGGSFNPWDTTGDTYDGGSFSNMPNVHIISSDYSHNMSMDDIVITGVRVVEKVDNLAHRFASDFRRSQNYAVGDRCCYNNDLYECISAVTAGSDFDESDWKKLPVVEYMVGSEGYVVSIEGNELVHGWQSDMELTPTGQEVANRLGYLLVGRKFRQASISHPSDPTIEAGDVALFIDRKGYQYPIIVSSTTFSNGDAQNTTSSAQTPQKNSSQRYSASTKNYVAMREQLSGETAYIENTINDKIANAGGLYETYTTNVKTGEGMIWHLHDKQNLAESNIVMMFSDVGFTLTSNYQDATPTWYGMTVDGTFIANTIQTINMFFDYAHGGTLKLGGTNNTYGRLTLVNANDVAFGHMGYTGPYTNQYGLTVGKYQANVYNYYVNVNSDGAIYYGKDKLPVDSIGRAVGARIRYAATPQTDSADIASWRADEADSLLVECDSTIIKSLSGGSADGRRAGVQVTPYYVNLNGWVYLNGTMLVSNGKGRLVKDTAYGDRTLYCYETPTPYFGDIGTAKTDENGEALISIDDIFDETVNTNVEYSVFLQKEGQGDLWVDEKSHSYFIVKGTPNLKFSWEVKAVQKGFELFRLDDDALRRGGNIPSDSLEKLLDDELDEYDRELEELYE